MKKVTRLRALCCECGNLRSVAVNYNAPCDDNRTDETSDRDGRGWRCTATLKCSNCRTKTRHALIRRDDDESRDVAERREYERIAAERGITKVAKELGFRLPGDALAGLADEDRRWAEDELHGEAVRRVQSIMGAVAPEDLTLVELGELIPLLRSFLDRRGGVQ
jgi:hypothetical protein